MWIYLKKKNGLHNFLTSFFQQSCWSQVPDFWVARGSLTSLRDDIAVQQDVHGFAQNCTPGTCQLKKGLQARSAQCRMTWGARCISQGAWKKYQNIQKHFNYANYANSCEFEKCRGSAFPRYLAAQHSLWESSACAQLHSTGRCRPGHFRRAQHTCDSRVRWSCERLCEWKPL